MSYLAISVPRTELLLFGEVLEEEGGDAVEGDYIKSVVEVGVRGAGYGHKFFVVAFEKSECVLAEIKRMGLVAVHDHNGPGEFAGILKEFEVEKR